MSVFRLALICVALSLGAERSRQELIDLVGRKGDDTHLYDLYLRTGVPSAETTSTGLYYSPTLGGVHGVDGMRLQPHLRGYNPYASVMILFPPIKDSGASVDHLTGMDVMDVVGGRYSNHAIKTRKGHVLIGDTLTASRLLQQGGGLQYHATLIRKSRQISADTDHVLIGYPDGQIMRDTLPLLSNCLGCEYWLIQYQQPIDSPWVIIPHAGEKIETFDSLAMRSNIGISWVHLFGQGDRWRVLGAHEKGAFLSTLSGVSPAVGDTAYYTIDNLVDLRVKLKPLLGTSNAGGTLLSIFGFNSNFTDSTLDTTYTATTAALGQDSGAITAATCILFLSGNGMRCVKNDLTPWKAGGTKGISYGAEFYGRLPRPPRHR